jgi:hypothetical protein
MEASMKVIHFKEIETLCDPGEFKAFIKFTACIVRDNSELVIEFLKDGTKYMLRAKNIEGSIYEGQYYKTMPQDVVAGEAKLKLYKNYHNNDEYLLYGKIIDYKTGVCLAYTELVIDKVVEG